MKTIRLFAIALSLGLLGAAPKAEAMPNSCDRAYWFIMDPANTSSIFYNAINDYYYTYC